MPHYQFVDQPDTIASVLTSHDHLGVDTEFMREKTYFAQLCLIQVATSDEIYCVDPLTDAGQEAFWRDFLARDWIVHSARQDIEVVFQASGSMPTSIFDTQIAAGLLGYTPQMGYAGLSKELFYVDMDMSHTRADWTKRPLRETYLEYAAEDVEYLLPAYDYLCERLERAGRLDWARQDSSLLLDPELYEVSADQAIGRLKGARNFSGRRRAAAARLAAWREREAIRRNRPRQWILRDNILLEIAYKLPEAEDQLSTIDGMSPKLLSRIGTELLRAVEASIADEHDYSPPRPPGGAQKALLKEMQARVAQCAEDLSLAAETIASKRELAAVVVSGKPDSRVFSGWRREIIGDDLLKLL